MKLCFEFYKYINYKDFFFVTSFRMIIDKEFAITMY